MGDYSTGFPPRQQEIPTPPENLDRSGETSRSTQEDLSPREKPLAGINEQTKDRCASLTSFVIDNYEPDQPSQKAPIRTAETALKVDQTFVNGVKQIAQGAVKRIFLQEDRRDTVLLIAKDSGSFSGILNKTPEQELLDEVHTANDISSGLGSLGRSGENLALDLTISDKKVQGKEVTIETAKAEGDLEKKVRDNSLSFLDRLGLAKQVVNGYADLHAADYVQGDGKPENALIYDGGKNVKISDWGKTTKVEGNEVRMYTGNPRYAPPEMTLSKKGEVYTTFVIVTRILEEQFLDDNTVMLVTDFEKKGEAIEKRRGIEKFLAENKVCSQVETKDALEKGAFLAKAGMNYVASHTLKFFKKESIQQLMPPHQESARQRETYKYIEALVVKLKNLDEYKGNEKAQTEIGKLEDLLKKMACTDRSQRPDMDAANNELGRILSALQAPESLV